MKFFIMALGILVIVVIGHEAYRVYRAIQVARPIIDSAIPYEQVGDGRSFLIAGESTGVGTGALRPEESVAGRLGAENSSVSIRNISKNGARFADLVLQLKTVPETDSYESVILIIGGNDILNFTPIDKVREGAVEAFKLAKARSGYVYLMTTGDVWNAPAFGPVLSMLYSARSKELREVLTEETKRAGVIYVDLFMDKDEDPFALEPLLYHAADGVHPSSRGYEVWYGKLKASMK